MIKLKMIIITCAFPFFGGAQVIIGASNNFDIYKPYTEEAQDYMKFNDQVKSHTWSLYAQCPVIRKNKWSLAFGLSFKNITHVIKDKFLYYPYVKTYYYNGWHTDTIQVYDPTDLKSTSRSLGVNGEFRYHLFTKNNFSGQLGINGEVYLREHYKSRYEELEPTSFNVFVEYEPLVPEVKKFDLASSNISVFYRHTWQFRPAFSLGAKISLGTNLNSDWDQFEKYVWLGAGIEMGFGKLKKKDS